jgi:Rrf2 family protein
MNVSVKGEYALQAILDLSLQRGPDPVKIADIAKRQKIPQKFLELILASLKQGGFVASKRGAEGGYLLARPADTITVGDVLRFVDGARNDKSTKRHDEHPLASFWRRLDESVSQIIDRTTFAELAREWEEQRAQYVPSWDI